MQPVLSRGETGRSRAPALAAHEALLPEARLSGRCSRRLNALSPQRPRPRAAADTFRVTQQVPFPLGLTPHPGAGRLFTVPAVETPLIIALDVQKDLPDS